MAVDYDPQKAHEYYERHKRLKGRRVSHSTKGWSQQKKEQWEYAKDQLSEQHKSINKNITELSKNTRAAMSAEAKEKISALRNRIKGMSKEQKAILKSQIQGMIDDIRGQLKSNKQQLTEKTKDSREKEKTGYAKRKDIAYNTIKSMK